MTPEQWHHIKEVYYGALDRPPGERSSFIDSACAGDESARQEVSQLITAYEETGEFLAVPAFEVVARSLADSPPEGLVEGQIISHYSVIRSLGAGGMGEVYLAEDTRLRRRVALKLLPASFTSDTERVRRFEREAHAASSLNHPNVCTIHEVAETEDGRRSIVMEYVEGVTLRRHMESRRMELTEVLDVATQIACALAAAHEVGVVHRDVKPENIMLRPDGIVKVLDFGLAKLTQQEPIADSAVTTRARVQTDTGMVMGTALYMSPEQARGLAVDTRTDIWSLGVVLYEMVAGCMPFTGETPNHVVVSILESEPPKLVRDAEVPAQLIRIILKALRKNMSDRYQAAGEIVLDLKNLKEELTVESRLKRFRRSHAANVAANRDRAVALNTITAAATSTAGGAISRFTSTAEYLVNGIKRHTGGAVFASTTALLIVSSLVYFFNFTKAGGEAIDSVAVLPFVNVGNDPNAEYLADGLSDSVIDRLSQLSNLKKVISLSSVLRYKGKQTDPQTVGRELSVRAVLTGRLTQRGDELLISTELVDVEDNKRLWGGQYNRKLADLPKLQSEIAQEIADRLRLKLTGTEKQRLAKSSTVDPEVYRLYLVGRFYRRSRTDKGLQKGLNYLGQAINKDPNFAPAYAQLAYTYFTMGFIGLLPPKEAEQKQEAAARRALELDDMLGDAHAALALRIGHVPDWTSSIRELQRALELDPNSADIHSYYAKTLWALGRLDEAIQHQKRAEELDPLSPVMYFDLGRILNYADQYDQAIEQCKKALELDPNYTPAHNNLARSYLALGKYKQALAEAETTTAIKSSRGEARGGELGYIYAALGKKAEALKILHELQERSKEQPVNPQAFALIYAGLGDKHQAFEFLEKQYQERGSLNMLKTFPELKGLRSDPRFTDLLRRMNLPE